MTGKRVLVIGRMSMSLVMNMYKIPALGETAVDDGGVAYVPGGEGAGAAIALAKLGADALLAGKIGADAHGQRLYKYYKDAGVNTGMIKVDLDEPTALSVTMREAEGERTLLYPGAGAKYTVDNISEAMSLSPDALYLGLGIPWNLVLNSARLAASCGVPIFVDASPAIADQPLESLPEVEIFSPNEEEIFTYTGIMPAGVESSLRAALALRKRVKAKYIVIKQGERGAFIYDGKKYFLVGAAKAGKVVDTSSVGDSFTAAMTLEYLRCGDIRTAVKYGAAAGAIAASREGSFGSIPTDAEVRDFMLKTGYGY